MLKDGSYKNEGRTLPAAELDQRMARLVSMLLRAARDSFPAWPHLAPPDLRPLAQV